MQGSDGGLKEIRPTAAQGERAVELTAPLGDLLGVPARPVLVTQQHELAVPESRFATGVVYEHHRQESVDFGLVRKQFGQRTA